jgi:hypothetical protein
VGSPEVECRGRKSRVEKSYIKSRGSYNKSRVIYKKSRVVFLKYFMVFIVEGIDILSHKK